jgi:hypothetical protein
VIDQLGMAELASEFWKLLRAFERSAALAPESARARLTAQARYSSERLASSLQKAGLRVVSFDGAQFEVNLPAVAVNAEDIPSGETTVVERTLEPAVVADNGIILTGKVFVAVSKHED